MMRVRMRSHTDEEEDMVTVKMMEDMVTVKMMKIITMTVWK